MEKNIDHKCQSRLKITILIQNLPKSINCLFCHLKMKVIKRSKYYTPSVELKDSNLLIDGKRFFDTPIKNEAESYEKKIEMERNNCYTTGNLLD